MHWTHLRANAPPLVLKPSPRAERRGITAGITSPRTTSERRGRQPRSRARGAPAVPAGGAVDGIDVRAHVISSRVVAAVTRHPAHVVGDGRRAITELVAGSSSGATGMPTCRSCLIVVDPALLASAGRTVHDIPAAEWSSSQRQANVGARRRGVDVTELVHPDLLTWRSTLLEPSPACGTLAGVDLMAPDHRHRSTEPWSWRSNVTGRHQDSPLSGLRAAARRRRSHHRRDDRRIGPPCPEAATPGWCRATRGSGRSATPADMTMARSRNRAIIG